MRKSASGNANGFITFKEIRRAFGNLFVMADGPTNAKRGTNKFEMLQQFIANNDPQALYFLAAYCFDLHLRMVYIVEALEHVGGVDADRKFAALVTQELEEINGKTNLPAKTWDQMAKDAHTVMMRAHDRIKSPRQKIVFDALR